MENIVQYRQNSQLRISQNIQSLIVKVYEQSIIVLL